MAGFAAWGVEAPYGIGLLIGHVARAGILISIHRVSNECLDVMRDAGRVEYGIARPELPRLRSNRRAHVSRHAVDKALVIMDMRLRIEAGRSPHLNEDRLLAPQELMDRQRRSWRSPFELAKLDYRRIVALREGCVLHSSPISARIHASRRIVTDS